MYIDLHVKYTLLFQILMKVEFSRQVFKNTHISNVMKIRPVGAKLFYADRRTDEHNKANITFHNFLKRPKIH